MKSTLKTCAKYADKELQQNAWRENVGQCWDVHKMR